MKFVVTGATGYIGERLVHHAMSLGHHVIAASRRPANVQAGWIPFDLYSASATSFPDGIDAVFHLAAATTLTALDPDTEIDAARYLIEEAERVRAKFVFVSSQTAREDAPTAYGRTKWQIERMVLAAGGLVVRPGQVYGGAERGLFGTLVSVVRRLLIIPAFFPAPKVQPVHVDDLAVALLRSAELNIVPFSTLNIGAPDPLSFTVFLRTIARVRVRRFRLSIPVPIMLVKLAGIAIGRHFRAKLGLDRITSLFDLPKMETRDDLLLLGVSLRTLASGMTCAGDGRRRCLIREGQALLAYVLKTKPNSLLVRRYVRCIEKIRMGQALSLPEFMLRLPLAVALLDEPGLLLPHAAGAEFVWRLNAAVVLAEASIQGARRFLAFDDSSGRFISMMHISYAVALEIWWRLLRLASAPFLKYMMRNFGLSR